MTCELYRHYDKNGLLIYVGISISTAARLAQHRIHSKWFKEIVLITIERFETRSEAYKAEEIAIKNENPKFNITYGTNPRDQSDVWLGAGDAAAMLGMKRGQLLRDVQLGRAPVKPLIDTKRYKWRIEHIQNYLAQKEKN